jgi:hypothetical protein
MHVRPMGIMANLAYPGSSKPKIQLQTDGRGDASAAVVTAIRRLWISALLEMM